MRNRDGVLHELVKNKILLFMLLPAVIYFFIFSYLPMVGIILPFKEYNYRDGIFGSPWSGIDNFKFLFSSGDMKRLSINTVYFNLGFLTVNLILQVSVAILINEIRGKWFKKITQTFMFLPYFLSWVVIGAFVFNLFNAEYGALNSIMKLLGKEPVNVYSNPEPWKFIIIAFRAWRDVGFGSIIYLAAITSIEQEMYESAYIDGASAVQQIWHITLPCLRPTIVILILLNLGHIMRGDFQLFFNVTGNSPILYEETDVIDTYVFRALIRSNDIGVVSAIGLYQSVFGFILTLTVNKIIKKLQPDYRLF